MAIVLQATLFLLAMGGTAVWLTQAYRTTHTPRRVLCGVRAIMWFVAPAFGALGLCLQPLFAALFGTVEAQAARYGHSSERAGHVALLALAAGLANPILGIGFLVFSFPEYWGSPGTTVHSADQLFWFDSAVALFTVGFIVSWGVAVVSEVVSVQLAVQSSRHRAVAA